MCRDGRGLGFKLVSFTKAFSKHPQILAIFKVDSEYLRFLFEVKVDYFILYLILAYSLYVYMFMNNVCACAETGEVWDLN